jgi:hypothetical protein
MLSKTNRSLVCPYGSLTWAQQYDPPKQSYQTHIKTRCAWPGSRQLIQLENSSQNGPNLDVPQKFGYPWSKEEIWEAVERGPHKSSLSPEAIARFEAESIAKVEAGQATIVE